MVRKVILPVTITAALLTCLATVNYLTTSTDLGRTLAQATKSDADRRYEEHIQRLRRTHPQGRLLSFASAGY